MVYCEIHEEQEECPKCAIIDLIEKVEGEANFMRGVALDPRTHPEVKEALRRRADDLDEMTGRFNTQ